jgi:hypothetical protein
MAEELRNDSYYVQGLNINGVHWDRNWFKYEIVMVEGSTIE